MWHQDMKLPHIRKTHPYINACSFKTRVDTAISPVHDHRPDHMTRVEAVISGLCVSFCREKHTQTSNSLLSVHNQQRWPLSASYLHPFPPLLLLLSSTFYTGFLFFLLRTNTIRKWNSQLYACVDSNVENSNATTTPYVQAMIKTQIKTKKKKKPQEYPVYMNSADWQRTMGLTTTQKRILLLSQFITAGANAILLMSKCSPIQETS